MRFKSFLFILIIIYCLGFITIAFAADTFRLTEAAGKMGFTANSNYSDVFTIIALAINLTLSLLAIIFFGMMMYAGICWLTSQGEDDKIEKAKTAIRAAIIGMVIVIGSYGISRFIFDAMNLGGKAGYCVITDNQQNTTCSSMTQKSCQAYGSNATYYDSEPAGCQGTKTKDECQTDNDCTSPKTCISNMCI